MPMQPNILLIVADELRADALSGYGNPVCRTPNLDRMAAAGTRFADCIVTQPTCTPSRASLLTGAFPSVLKTRMVGCHAPDDPRFLGHGLQRAGYRCASIGKIHLVPQREEPEVLHAPRWPGTGAMATTGSRRWTWSTATATAATAPTTRPMQRSRGRR